MAEDPTTTTFGVDMEEFILNERTPTSTQTLR